MKYMLIIYGNEELWNSVEPAEQQRLFAAFDEFNKTHYASGELLGAYGVADAAATKLVRRARRPARRHRRPVPGDQGVPGQLVPDRRRQRAASARDRRRVPSAVHQPTEVWPILHEASRETGADMGVA